MRVDCQSGFAKHWTCSLHGEVDKGHRPDCPDGISYSVTADLDWIGLALATVEAGHDIPRKMRFKLQPFLGTLCHSEMPFSPWPQLLVWNLSYAMKGGFLLVPA